MVKVSRRRAKPEVLCSWGEGIARKTGREKGRCRLEVEKIRLEVCDFYSHLACLTRQQLTTRLRSSGVLPLILEKDVWLDTHFRSRDTRQPPCTGQQHRTVVKGTTRNIS